MTANGIGWGWDFLGSRNRRWEWQKHDFVGTPVRCKERAQASAHVVLGSGVWATGWMQGETTDTTRLVLYKVHWLCFEDREEGK